MPMEPENSPYAGYKLNRRNFIHYSSMIAGGVMLSPLLSRAAIKRDIPADNELFWYRKPLRIMHTVLRETDAKNYDANAVVQYLKKDGCNALCVNAGGIVDFFKILYPQLISIVLWGKGIS